MIRLYVSLCHSADVRPIHPATGCDANGFIRDARNARNQETPSASRSYGAALSEVAKNRVFGGAVSNGVYLGQPRATVRDQRIWWVFTPYHW